MKKLQKPNFPQQIFTKMRKNACKICLYINDRKFSDIHQKSHKIQFEGIIQEFMDQNHQKCGPILTISIKKREKTFVPIIFGYNMSYCFCCIEPKLIENDTKNHDFGRKFGLFLNRKVGFACGVNSIATTRKRIQKRGESNDSKRSPIPRH